MFVPACVSGDDDDDDDDDDDSITNENSCKKCFLPKIKTKNYNIEFADRHFYDQSINDLIKQYDEIRKISTGQGDDYTTDFFFRVCLF